MSEGDTPDTRPPLSTGVPAKMKVGFNYPWSSNEYGAQIGPYPHMDWNQYVAEQKLAYSGKEKSIPLPPMFKYLDRNLDHLNTMGVGVVRWFLLGSGFNYGLGGAARNLKPAPPSDFWVSEWEFGPPLKADPRFAYHFEELLKRFKKAGLQLIPSFVDFGWVGDFDYGAERPGSRTAGRRTDTIVDPAKRHVLFTFLNELLKVSRSYANQIFAWEVCNEPIWMTLPVIPHTKAGGRLVVHRTNDPATPWRGGAISRDQLKTFLEEGVQQIEAGGFKGKSTVGHRYYDDIAGPDPLPTGSMPQFHYYADAGRDPDRMPKFTGANPPFLGEFATDLAGGVQARKWTQDLPSSDTTLERLKLVERQGCRFALLWPDKGGRLLFNRDGSKRYPPGDLHKPEKDRVQMEVPEDWIKLEEASRRQLVQFTGKTFVALEPHYHPEPPYAPDDPQGKL